jgi:cation transport ATPase
MEKHEVTKRKKARMKLQKIRKDEVTRKQEKMKLQKKKKTMLQEKKEKMKLREKQEKMKLQKKQEKMKLQGKKKKKDKNIYLKRAWTSAFLFIFRYSLFHKICNFYLFLSSTMDQYMLCRGFLLKMDGHVQSHQKS